MARLSNDKASVLPYRDQCALFKDLAHEGTAILFRLRTDATHLEENTVELQ